MGNNHEKFFSKEKRKLLVLGLNGVGKSSIYGLLYFDSVGCENIIK